MTAKGIWGTGIAALLLLALVCIWHHRPDGETVMASNRVATQSAKTTVPVAPAVAPSASTSVTQPVTASASSPAAPSAAVPAPAPAPSAPSVSAPVVAAPAVSAPSTPAPKLSTAPEPKASVPSAVATKPTKPVVAASTSNCAPTSAKGIENVIRSVCFRFGSDRLTATSRAKLKSAIADLKASSAKYELAGFTDSIGAADYNQKLAERRAQAVKRYLEKNGVDAAKFSVKSVGFETPNTSDAPAKAASMRRVDVRQL